MQVLVNASGERIFQYSPAVDQANQFRNLYLYDPNGNVPNTGLYDRSQPACMRWVDHFHQHEKRFHSPPAYSIDIDGRTNLPPWVRPAIYKNRLYQ